MDNLLLMTDSYKVSHWKQYPPGTETVYSNFESRGGKWNDIVFFGLQYLLEKYLESWRVTQPNILEAADLLKNHIGHFNSEGWYHILDKHNGHLPVSIKAVPEGTVVPVHNVLMTIENTDPKCYWLTNYLETLLVQTWYPCTVATQSREMKKILLDYLNITGTPADIDFKLHDFGFRGVSSVESAGIGGAAHLVNFKGTDTLAGIVLAEKYYAANMPGFSIPAAEHSTITSWGRDKEVDAFRNMLDQYPKGLVAVVSDSYNIYNACRNLWGIELKDKVISRDGTVVVRPDSGDPITTVIHVLDALGENFGTVKNKKGYKVLPSQLRIIQGDGIDIVMMQRILDNMYMRGYSADNIAFGSGGGLLQKLDRDTCKFAFKCSSVTVNGEERDVWKDPITDSGKKSKRGKLKLIKTEDGFKTVRNTEQGDDNLVEVFRDGKILVRHTFDEIRERAKI
ncbi:nicotinate phosphoribosyltransferase [Candidatus Parcubacteria bacterium]|nr:MAG: nicotinate phosphoribosyltransferase [Candidatus Parcubacteria bacterium]